MTGNPSAVANPDRTPVGPPGETAGRRRLFVVFMLSAAVFIGFLLRLQTISTRSVWFDEAWSWRMSRFPVPELLRRTAADVHPPLYYLILKAWTAGFGDSPFALRSLSALFGAATILAVYFTVRQARPASAGPAGAALFVAALVALSVFQIRYGGEARMYALGTFLYAASGAALFRALRVPDHAGKWWTVYGALIILFAYTHYFALLSIAAQVLFLAGFLLVRSGGRWRVLVRDAQAWRAWITFAVFTAALLPWAPIFFRQLRQVHDDFWPSPVTAWSLPSACYQMFVDPENAASHRVDAAGLALACSCGLALLLRKARAAEWYAFCGAVVPCAAAFFLSLAGMRLFYVRYLLFAHLALLTGLGLVVWRIPSAGVRLTVVLLMLVNFFAAHVRFVEGSDPARHGGACAAAAYLAENRRRGEPVVVSSAFFYFPLQYYLRDDDCRLYQGADGLRHFQGVPLFVSGDGVSAADVRACHAGRVWVVDAANVVWAPRHVSTPAEWKYEGETPFPESFHFQGSVVVTKYDVPGG